MVSKKMIFAAAALLLSSMPLAAADQNVLHVALNLDPSTTTLDPQIDTSAIGTQILPNIFEPLVSLAFDANGVSHLKPALATAWRRLDDRTLEFDLRPGVKFQDGTDFTSADVVFTFDHNRILAKNWPGAAAMQPYFSDITVSAIGDYQVRVTSAQPDPMLLYRMTHSTAMIISKEAFEAAPSLGDWTRKPVGTGPYRVADYKPKQQIELEAFNEYWGGQPPAGRVELAIVPELAGRISGLVAGQYDLVMNIPPDQGAVIEEYPGLKLVGGAVNNVEFIVFDTFVPVLRDAGVREALSLAIDRHLLVDTFFQGRTQIPRGYQLPAFADIYDETRPEPSFDKERAKAILAKSSYKGEVIPFKVRNNYYANEIARAEVIAGMWQDIGVNVKLSVVETSADTIGGIRNSSNNMSYPDPAGMQLRVWGPNSVYDTTKSLDGIDKAAFFAPQANLASEFDASKRKKESIAWLDQWDKQLPGTVLYQSTRFYGVDDKIEWAPSPDLVTYFGPGNLTFR